MKILYLFMFILFVSCEEMGSTTNNYYGDSSEEQIIDTDWGQDPLICGTELSDTTYLYWEIQTIMDEQQVLCYDNEGNSCDEYLSTYACIPEYDNGIFFHKDGSFSFLRYVDNEYNCSDSSDAIGTWATMNGKLELTLSDPSSNTITANYFFNERTYNYSTDIGSRDLILSDDRTQITLKEYYYY